MALLDEGTDRYLRIGSDGSGVLPAVLDGLAPHHTRRRRHKVSNLRVNCTRRAAEAKSAVGSTVDCSGGLLHERYRD